MFLGLGKDFYTPDYSFLYFSRIIMFFPKFSFERIYVVFWWIANCDRD